MRRYTLQHSPTEGCVNDYSLTAVTFNVTHFDEIYMARIQSLPILRKIGHRGAGRTPEEAMIDAMEGLAVRLNEMAETLRFEIAELR